MKPGLHYILPPPRQLRYFLDFWLPAPIPGADLIDQRALAESELARLAPQDGERPLVWVNGFADWLAREAPVEWLGDMLATLAKYPANNYALPTTKAPQWQSRMWKLADMGGVGGNIAARWLDGQPPENVRLVADSVFTPFLLAIPQRPYSMANPMAIINPA